MTDPRLDKVLWSLRVFKTRPLATEACRSGQVTIGEREAKAGRDLHVGDVLEVQVGGVTRRLKILALPRTRVGAKQLPEFMVDLTLPEEYARARQAGLEQRLAREQGRPSKKERRDRFALFESSDDGD